MLSDVIGGDWGKETPDPTNTEPVSIIRGTDIPNLRNGGVGSVPLRYTTKKKVERRILHHGDIVIEVSGGSPTQPTGRSMVVSPEISWKGFLLLWFTLRKLLPVQNSVDYDGCCFDRNLNGRPTSLDDMRTRYGKYRWDVPTAEARECLYRTDPAIDRQRWFWRSRSQMLSPARGIRHAAEVEFGQRD